MTSKIRCVIIDDEPFAISVIQSHLSLVGGFEIIDIFHSGIEAYQALKNMDIDVIFLDIQMPKISGLSMLKMLKNPPATIITTAHRDYAIEGFNLNAVDYLLKPVGIERFMQAIDKVKFSLKQNQNLKPIDHEKYIFIKSERRYYKVLFEEILFIEALKNHIRIVRKEDTLISLMPISEIALKLPKDSFLKTHRSFIINKSEINTFSSSEIDLKGHCIPVGRTFKNQVKIELQFLIRK